MSGSYLVQDGFLILNHGESCPFLKGGFSMFEVENFVAGEMWDRMSLVLQGQRDTNGSLVVEVVGWRP